MRNAALAREPCHRYGPWLLAAVLCAIEIAAAPFSAATLDTARDLHWALEVLDDPGGPLAGPRIGDRFTLGPLWFYLLAIPLGLGQSMTAAAIGVGALSAAKYPLALMLGTRLLDRRLGVLWMVILAGPSIAAFTWVTWTHVSMALTAALLAGLAMRADFERSSRGTALAVGASIALMLHAHPTLIALAAPVPWLLLRRRGHRLQRLLWMVAPTVLALAPVLLAPGSSLADGGTFERPSLTRAILDAPGLLVRTLVSGSDAALHLATAPFPAWLDPLRWLLVAAGAGALVGLAGTVLRAGPARRLLLATAALLAIYLLFVALIRPTTWWYMMLGGLAPASLLVALGWRWLPRMLHGVPVVLGSGHAALLLATLVQTGLSGTPRYFSPVLIDLKRDAPQRAIGADPWLPMFAQDRIGRMLCAGDGLPVLHGTLAFNLDPTAAVLQRLHCPGGPRWRLGGTEGPSAQSVFGIAGDRAGAETVVTIAGLALYPIHRTLFPRDGLPVGDAASEKLRGWARLQPRAPVRRTLVRGLDGGLDVAIANPFHWQSRLEDLSVRVDGGLPERIADDGVTAIFRCTTCRPGRPAIWTVAFTAVDGYPPDIVAIEPGPRSDRAEPKRPERGTSIDLDRSRNDRERG